MNEQEQQSRQFEQRYRVGSAPKVSARPQAHERRKARQQSRKGSGSGGQYGSDTGKFTLIHAFRCAAQGIWDTSHERNFRIETGFMVACIVLGFAFGISVTEWLVVIICFGLVLGGECFNSALEALVDLASPGYHELARKAKDAAAGGVLLFSLASLVIGICLFAPRIVGLFF